MYKTSRLITRRKLTKPQKGALLFGAGAGPPSGEQFVSYTDSNGVEQLITVTDNNGVEQRLTIATGLN